MPWKSLHSVSASVWLAERREHRLTTRRACLLVSRLAGAVCFPQGLVRQSPRGPGDLPRAHPRPWLLRAAHGRGPSVCPGSGPRGGAPWGRCRVLPPLTPAVYVLVLAPS